MKKTEFVEAVAGKTGSSKKDVEKFIAAYQEVIIETLAAGDDVVFVDFGAFSTADRPAQTGRNPRTGEAMPIPAETVPKFRPGKALKDALNK